MIHLMLNTNGVETGCFKIHRFAVAIKGLHPHNRWPRNFSSQPVHAETAFPVFNLFGTIEHNLGIDENRLRKSILPSTPHDDQLNRARHLWRSQADPWFSQHRLDQIIDELLDIVRADVARIDW